VTLTDRLPGALWPIIERGVESTRGNCPLPPPDQYPIIVKCELGTLPPGESAEIFILVGVHVRVAPGTVITNTAVVTSDQNPKGNQAVSTIEVIESPKLTPNELNELGLSALGNPERELLCIALARYGWARGTCAGLSTIDILKQAMELGVFDRPRFE